MKNMEQCFFESMRSDDSNFNKNIKMRKQSGENKINGNFETQLLGKNIWISTLEWMFNSHQVLGFEDEDSLLKAITLLIKYIIAKKEKNQNFLCENSFRRLKLISICIMWICSKLYDTQQVSLSAIVKKFIFSEEFTIKEILDMEIDVLQTMNFKIILDSQQDEAVLIMKSLLYDPKSPKFNSFENESLVQNIKIGYLCMLLDINYYCIDYTHISLALVMLSLKILAIQYDMKQTNIDEVNEDKMQLIKQGVRFLRKKYEIDKNDMIKVKQIMRKVKNDCLTVEKQSSKLFNFIQQNQYFRIVRKTLNSLNK
ncbi:UNKNOWN [Stylonychia lemnae]|uniref:Cyclin N-terminal domain-containing protein n=1 Tax=Stylonychia lemnae TaxID=5949 RepID=A0A078ALM7_STYLE|nr:UNKNOWN [Stylonychia lemnae]|eukprot:CDW83260.1 UNKNOWN [Stylonychia lemnae]